MKPTDAAYTQRCRMTSLGGSEKGTCPCQRPSDCEMQSRPEYVVARIEAQARMARLFRNLVKQ